MGLLAFSIGQMAKATKSLKAMLETPLTGMLNSISGTFKQLCRDRQQGHEAKDRNGDLREPVGFDPAHHVHGPGQDQDRGGHAGQGLGALVLLPGLDRAGQLLKGARDGVEIGRASCRERVC